jgi:hypothetical protein
MAAIAVPGFWRRVPRFHMLVIVTPSSPGFRCCSIISDSRIEVNHIYRGDFSGFVVVLSGAESAVCPSGTDGRRRKDIS